MNYDKLKGLISNNKLTIAKACTAIGRTDVWFHRVVKKNNITIADLEKLLKLCKTSLGEFFGGVPGYQTVNEPSARESDLNEEVNELLRENRQLRLRIEELEGKHKPAMAKPKAY